MVYINPNLWKNLRDINKERKGKGMIKLDENPSQMFVLQGTISMETLQDRSYSRK